MKKILIACLVFIGFIVVGAVIMYLQLSSNMKTIREIPISDFDVTFYQDQTIIGEYYFEDQIGATVEVTIEDGAITNILFIEHIAGLGEKAEIITEEIINTQSLLVDDISGATTSSHVIKLAISDALEGIE